ncbi:MAG: hypothetical protein IT208_11170, partial [Chthonomonadales bacterium]|nr:hypothetical protein [Chthonomonadales bacterium]
IGGVLPLLQPTRVLLSSLLVSAANDWLANQLNQQSSKFRQGDVFALGDVYALTGAQNKAEPRGLAPILAPVTLKIVTAANAGAATTPAPPPPANGGTLNLVSPSFSDTLMLAKGYNWRATGNITSPIGFQPVNQPILFATPASDPVEVPCTLTVLLKLTIVTTGGPPFAALVKMTREGQTYFQGNSSLQQDGRWAVVLIGVPPGTYTIEAPRIASGYPPLIYRGAATEEVVPAPTRETTVTLAIP